MTVVDAPVARRPQRMTACRRGDPELSKAIPFLTAYDPPGTSEGTLDPLGLYQIADQLAVRVAGVVRKSSLMGDVEHVAT